MLPRAGFLIEEEERRLRYDFSTYTLSNLRFSTSSANVGPPRDFPITLFLT